MHDGHTSDVTGGARPRDVTFLISHDDESPPLNKAWSNFFPLTPLCQLFPTSIHTMVRTTRQAIRLAAQASSTATPISNNSPGVSSRQASTAADTPPTSEDELLISKEASFSSRITSKKSLGKRSRKDDDVEMDDEALGSARSNKRANRAYVAVPSTPQRNEKVRLCLSSYQTILT